MTTSSSSATQRLDEPARQAALLKAHPALARLASRYDILQEIGSGGMGHVFQARDRETGDVLALKILRPEIAMDATMAERFKNELRLARRITHKNVCRIYDFNRIDALACISMEYVDGETLRACIDRTGPLPIARVRALASQLCAGLSEAHAQSIVHRDLKPENIMITKSGAAKIMDFGIARSANAGATLTQALIGTPAYMAPEQVQGKTADARSDIYALGLILYECVTGRRAFTAPTPVAIAIKQVQERPVSPHAIRAEIPRALESLILRCLEKEPTRRFGSVHELAGALARISAPETIAARPRRWLWWAVPLAAAALTAGVLIERRGAHSIPSARAPSAVAPSPQEQASGTAPAPVASGSVANEEPTMKARTEKARERQLFERLKSEAEAGNADAQLRLGKLLAVGPAAVRDEQKGRQWLERSAEQGNAEAAFMLGGMYERGRGVERNVRAAIHWYERAAQAGHEGAARSLARLNERGAGRRLR